MKKFLSFALALAMALSLTACGGGEETSVTPPAQQESSTSTPAEVAPEPSEPAVEPENTDSVPAEDQPQTDAAPSFDPHWASAEYELPIPQPPFECEVEVDDRGRYTIKSVNSDEMKALPLSAITDYCETIKALGYSNSLRENVLETGRDRQGYEFYGEMEGSCVMLTDDAFGCMIMVIMQE